MRGAAEYVASPELHPNRRPPSPSFGTVPVGEEPEHGAGKYFLEIGAAVVFELPQARQMAVVACCRARRNACLALENILVGRCRGGLAPETGDAVKKCLDGHGGLLGCLICIHDLTMVSLLHCSKQCFVDARIGKTCS